jgi:glutamyl-tRNA reductase
MAYNRAAGTGNFFVAGVNYKKTDAESRGMFAINSEQYENIINLSQSYGVKSLFILSTCNRTEIYGFATQAKILLELLVTQTKGDLQTLINVAYVKGGNDAVEHLFKVGAGLDSQILGDYEIVGQLKHAVKFSKDRNGLCCFLERLTNNVFQASKEIKNETGLSSGSVSVSFSVVQFLKQSLPDCTNKNILLIGTGKIGRSTCKNLVDYAGATNITLINRSDQKAAELADELGLKYAPVEDTGTQIASADIILVATNSNEPTILKSQLENKGSKLIIDLSVPYSVEQSVSLLDNIRMVNIDEISKIKDDTIKTREAEVPKAEKIIQKYIGILTEWQLMRQNASALRIIKSMLNEIALLHHKEFLNPQTKCPYIAAEQKIQQVINKMAGKMRTENKPGCHYLQAINEFIVSNKS